MSTTAERVAERFARASSDALLLQAGLHVEEVSARAYAAAAAATDDAAERAWLERYAAHEREHVAAFETMLQALTVPVREHAGPAALDTLAPGLRAARGPAALEALAALEGAAIAGHQVLGRRLEALEPLRTVAAVMAGAAQHLVVLRDALGRAQLTNTYETGA